jgi:hypothetical protein
MSITASLRVRPRPSALGARGRSVIGVGIGVAILLIVNGLVHETAGPASAGQFVGAPPLPVVEMARPSAWRCPGPLPVGAGKESSRIAMANSSLSAASVTVSVARTDAPVGGISTKTTVSRVRLELDGRSQAVITLPRNGAAGFAAVSVDTDAGGIGVSESIRGLSGPAGGGIVASPCTLGSAPRGLIPAGSTYGSSDVRLGLYDPDATPAVVNVAVSNGASVVSPPAFQGVVVPANGLVVLDLRRWVFQVSSLAITATAVSGDIVIGSFDTTAEAVTTTSGSSGTHRVTRVYFAGGSLLIGPDRPLGQWSLTALQSRLGVASMFSVYDPGTKPVSVSVAPPGQAGRVAALTEDVPAGGIVEFQTPIAPGTRLGAKSVIVTAAGSAVVVARVTARQRSHSLEELNTTFATAGPGERWLLPGGSVSAGIDDIVTVSDPGTKSATVSLVELPDLPATRVQFKAFTVLAGSQRNVDLKTLMKQSPEFALEVTSSAPVLVEQQLRPRHGETAASGAIPVLP